MTHKIDTDKYEKKLRASYDEVMAEIKKLEAPTDFGNEPGSDLGEKEQDEDEELENRGSVANTMRNRLEDIEHAINKIKNSQGEYGKCENCGNGIETEILNLVPESRLCKNCKTASH